MPGRSNYEMLPRSEIRKRLEEGSMRESQLIWHSSEQSWKPTRAFPDLKRTTEIPSPSSLHPSSGEGQAGAVSGARATTTFFVATPEGGKYETLSRTEIRRRLRVGAMRESRLIWHPSEQTWKPAHVFPNLKRTGPQRAPLHSPSVRRRAVTVLPHSAPRTLIKEAVGASDPAVQPSDAKMRTIPHSMVEGRRTVLQRYWKWVSACAGLAVFAVLLTIFLNWLMVHRPLVLALERSGFDGLVKVRGHYSLYVRSDSLVIDFRWFSDQTTPEQLVDILTALAVATDEQMMAGSILQDVQLTKDGDTRFLLQGKTWQQLASDRMQPVSSRTRLLMNQLYLPDGSHALSHSRQIRLHDQQENLLSTFYESLVGKPMSSRVDPPH